jgi:glutamate synthase domain-containing protein 1
MCGIAGFLQKDPSEPPGAAPAILTMLQSLSRRGPDSAGVALYGTMVTDGYIVRAWYGDDEELGARAVEAARELWPVVAADQTDGYLRLVLTTGATAREVADALDREGVAVFSIGRSLEIVKHELEPRRLGEIYGLAAIPARHGIGHTRMATESRVDVQHAHPFWARPFEDVAVVHNGHITNYHRLRRIFEMRGHRFRTGNDTELIAVYIADRIAKGSPLSEAVSASMRDLDGSFTYLIATAEGFGMARDPFASKPGLIFENDEVVAVASEEHAIEAALGETKGVTREAGAAEAITWTLPTSDEAAA